MLITLFLTPLAKLHIVVKVSRTMLPALSTAWCLALAKVKNKFK
jgi:hypothetical protein